ncbi:DUF4255 domain-containing protein [Dinoroseobacter sp. PD6]|uniref:DUF4255 domain-containing protein n=1 Tax=Dinoroseobacter sp. PD6 TaxID=3028384 RepID=UPI00237B87CE|nr:DUF4255 domain-containing protein [Dinoroseobacter sp. PD6]MDD9716296.1 DUF4255 domain-containing protein [Dinoroseobacter sp. PD6]
MIDATLKFLTAMLNEELRTRFAAASDLVALESVARDPGAGGEETANRLVLTLVNIEREGTAGNTGRVYREEGGVARRAPQPLNINLIFLLSANFPDQYADGLRVLSAGIGAFQARPLFTPQSDPTLPEGIERLSVEWRDLDLQSIHNLWTVLGGTYLPSAVYKARMLVVEDGFVGTDVSRITSTAVET